MIYLGLFAATAAAATGYIYYKTNSLLTEQLEDEITAELRNLDQQYKQSGLNGLVRAVAERAELPGNSLYLIADAEGHYLGGNLKAVSQDLWNSTGQVLFVYRRSFGNEIQERSAFAVVFRLTNGYRLVVGRDIEDQRQFGHVVRSAFLWTLIAIAAAGVGGGILLGRNLLRRIETITDTTRQIMAGDLSGRIPVTQTGDEFDRLAVSLNAMLKRIEELIAGFKEVSDNIAHDLRTPLNRLRNRLESALQGPENALTYKDALQTTIEEADDLIKTFDALLSIARLEAGAAQYADETFDLAAVVADVAELYEPVAEECGLTLHLENGEQTMIKGKRELMAQAIANIVDNAIKYGQSAQHSNCANADGADGDIVVRLLPTSKDTQIIVADRGPGILPEDRERVFKRFVRLEASRSQPGTGLGLSLASAVARLHGGRLFLSDNKPGLKVTLAIPRPDHSQDKTA
jgi:signal transduction histidine kinase